MNSKEIQNKKTKLKLNDFQRSLITGLLLGDGHLETQNKGRTYRLKVEHCLEQKDYLKWLHDHFKNWVRNGIYQKKKSNGKIYVGFNTYSHGALRFYAQQFYGNKKKKIPKMIGKILDPIGIAIWFMDDGSWKSKNHNTYIIHTLGFNKKDLEIIQKVFLQKFGIKTSLHRQKRKYLRLYILSESSKDFKKLIYPYVNIFSSMKKKLGNNNA